MEKTIGWAAALGACTMLAACGGGLYRPAAASLGKSFETMNKSLAATLEDYPNQFRAASIDRYAPQGLAPLRDDPSLLLCAPIYNAVLAGQLANEIGVSSAALVSTAGESPEGFSALLADTLAGHTIAGSEDDPAAIATGASDRCKEDAAGLVEARNQFTNQSGLEFAGALGGLIALWDLVKPIAKGGLGIVNQQQREAAIRDFIVREGDALRENARKLAAFSRKKATYERAMAAHDFQTIVRKSLADGSLSDKEREEVLDAATVYDTLREQDPSGAYDSVGKGIERLQKVARGEYGREDLGAAIASLGRSIGSLNAISQSITELEKGGKNNKALNDAIDKIRGKKPAPAE